MVTNLFIYCSQSRYISSALGSGISWALEIFFLTLSGTSYFFVSFDQSRYHSDLSSILSCEIIDGYA